MNAYQWIQLGLLALALGLATDRLSDWLADRWLKRRRR